jgi:signal peptide peptidase SppA
VKPVNAFVSGNAASAAYYLLSQASSITLTPSGEVGSVGVIMVHTDLTKMLDKMGIKITAITAGKYKAELWPFTALTDEAKASVQAEIDNLYGGFLSAINRGRGTRVTPAMKADNYGEGRMFQAKDALDSGLVDRVSTIREAFKARADSNRATAEGQRRKGELDTL